MPYSSSVDALGLMFGQTLWRRWSKFVAGSAESRHRSHRARVGDIAELAQANG
jgi:hypothetical protein